LCGRAVAFLLRSKETIVGFLKDTGAAAICSLTELDSVLSGIHQSGCLYSPRTCIASARIDWAMRQFTEECIIYGGIEIGSRGQTGQRLTSRIRPAQPLLDTLAKCCRREES
jgi:hypothetical protein